MKRLFLVLLAAVLVISRAVVGCAAPEEEEEQITIGIFQLIPLPDLDLAREGFKRALSDEGLVDVQYIERRALPGTDTGYTIHEYVDISYTIADYFVSKGVDLICAITTPCAIAAALAVKGTNIPVVFNSVTDPVVAGICDSWDAPGGQVTGVSDTVPIEPNLGLMTHILQANDLAFEKLGVIYNPFDAHSAYQVKTQLIEAIELLGLNVSVEEYLVYDTAEVSAAAEALVGRVDAILIPANYPYPDPAAYIAFDDTVPVAEENDIPLFGNPWPTKGTIAWWVPDYYVVGYLSGQMAAKILLENTNPATMPIQTAPPGLLYLNLGAAERMGVIIPDDLLHVAHQIIE